MAGAIRELSLDHDPAGDPSSAYERSRDHPIDPPMLNFATKKLMTGANGQKEDAAWFPFARAVVIEQSSLKLVAASGDI